MRSPTAVFFIILALIPAPALSASFPSYINYQGKLGNPAGNPLTGTYSFRFKFYDQATGGTLLATDANFTGVTNAVTVTNGLYSVQIGSLTAGGLPESVFHGAETWLQIEVSPGTDFTSVETLLPRERLASVPFAFRAANAEKLGIGVALATFTAAGNLELPYGVTGGTASFSGGVQVGDATASTLSAAGYLALANLGAAPATAAPGRLFFDSTVGTLRFSTGTTAGSWVNISTTPQSAVMPVGIVAHFNLAACPAGWSALAGARGRYLVGLPVGGTLAGTDGTALTNLEDRPVGQHNHGITDPGHLHTLGTSIQTYGAPALGSGVETQIGSSNTGSATTGVTINNAGGTAGTNAPYIQLLVCEYTGP